MCRYKYYSFIRTTNSSKCIEQIIRKYKDLCWNDLHPHSEVTVLCHDVSEIDESIKWLNENHILHNVCKVDSSDKSLEYLKKIAADAEVSLENFWDCYVEDDEWIKDNVGTIKTPIFIKLSDVSIYSNPGIRSVEMVSIGFDKNILSEKLLC